MESAAEQEKILRGIIKRVTYSNPDTGYSVIQLSITDTTDEITVVGQCVDVKVGAHLVVRGAYKEHPRFGYQFNAKSITHALPTGSSGIEKYLGSGLIKGIGKKTAERIVEELGDKAVEAIIHDPEKVAKIQGVGRKKAKLLSKALGERHVMSEIVRFLVEHSISSRLAQKIYDKYGSKSLERINEDPYRLARELNQVGFSTADTVAMKLGLPPDSPQRLRAGIVHALEKGADDGHCFLPIDQLASRARILLGVEESVDLAPYVYELSSSNYIVLDNEDVYLARLYNAEKFVSDFIRDRSTSFVTPLISGDKVTGCIQEIESDLNISLTAEQKEAVLSVTKYPLVIITGGPGCGKTTIIRAISRLFAKEGMRLALAAPTGRAAQRMAQVSDMPASTIHRLLRFDPSTRSFFYGVNEPLDIDAIVVDEASMLDMILAKDLFSAIPKGAPLILVGDRDQLPSVGPGRVFGELVSIKSLPVVSLFQVFRRTEQSTINTIAHMVNSGIVPDIPAPDGVTKVDAYFIPRTSPEESSLMIENLVADQLPKKFGFESEEIVVLTPTNRGPLGTQVLNEKLQERLNPKSARGWEEEISFGSVSLRVGDRVCQRVNNYQIDPAGVFNGDIGTIFSIDRSTGSLRVELWDGRLVKYAQNELDQLSLAYAVTVHRSQGSEIPCVVLAIDNSHYSLLERQLIYTAITRAKKLLVIVGSRKALSIGVQRSTTKRRYTGLKRRVILDTQSL